MPYSNYRGVAARSGRHGVDPARSVVQVGGGLAGDRPARGDGLHRRCAGDRLPLRPAGAVAGRLLHEEDHRLSGRAASRPDARCAAHRRTLQPVSIGLLPSTLPYPTVSVHQEGATLPDSLRHRVRFVAEGDGATSFDITLDASALVNRRLTLSYVPATVDDQIAAHAFLGLENTPAYLLKLRPVLKLGGVIVKAGETPVQMGATHTFTIEIQTPRGTVPIANPVVAGGYYAIGLGAHQVRCRRPTSVAAEDTEEGAGTICSRTWPRTISSGGTRRSSRSPAILGVVHVRPALSEVMIGLAFNVTLAVWSAAGDRVARRRSSMPICGSPILCRSAEDDGLRSEFMRLSGLAGSMLEGEMLERNLQVDAVSAARLIQLARAEGIPSKSSPRPTWTRASRSSTPPTSSRPRFGTRSTRAGAPSCRNAISPGISGAASATSCSTRPRARPAISSRAVWRAPRRPRTRMTGSSSSTPPCLDIPIRVRPTPNPLAAVSIRKVTDH